MAKPPAPPAATDEEVRALLERYRCPVPFHEVRTRFLGNIATPVMSASPIKTVEGLWGGELPDLGSIEAANELIGALIMGLWNRLTRHQERNTPFRLTRPEVAASREGLATLALIRRQELEGFVEGLFGAEEAIDLPERAHRGLGILGQLRALIAGVLDVATDANGNVYVADTNNNRIQKFDPSGTFVAAWGTSGSGNGQFAGPTGVAADASGNVYVADQSNNRIQKFACP